MSNRNKGISDMVGSMFDNITYEADDKGTISVKEAGEKGGQVRKKQIENDPKKSYEKMGKKGGSASRK